MVLKLRALLDNSIASIWRPAGRKHPSFPRVRCSASDAVVARRGRYLAWAYGNPERPPHGSGGAHYLEANAIAVLRLCEPKRHVLNRHARARAASGFPATFNVARRGASRDRPDRTTIEDLADPRGTRNIHSPSRSRPRRPGSRCRSRNGESAETSRTGRSDRVLRHAALISEQTHGAAGDRDLRAVLMRAVERRCRTLGSKNCSMCFCASW